MENVETRIIVKEYNSKKVEYICEKRRPKTWYKYFHSISKNLGWEIITFKWGYGVNEYNRKAIFETNEQAKLCIEDFLQKEERNKTWLNNQKIKSVNYVNI